MRKCEWLPDVADIAWVLNFSRTLAAWFTTSGSTKNAYESIRDFLDRASESAKATTRTHHLLVEVWCTVPVWPPDPAVAQKTAAAKS